MVLSQGLQLGLAMRLFLLMRITNKKNKPLLMWSF